MHFTEIKCDYESGVMTSSVTLPQCEVRHLETEKHMFERAII